MSENQSSFLTWLVFTLNQDKLSCTKAELIPGTLEELRRPSPPGSPEGGNEGWGGPAYFSFYVYKLSNHGTCWEGRISF